MRTKLVRKCQILKGDLIMKVRYIVKKDEGVIVCLGEYASLDVAKDLGFIPKSGEVDLIELIPYMISDTYKGVARLCEEDEWDENFGKEVAHSKMLAKYHKAKTKKIESILADLEDTERGLRKVLESYKN